MNPCGCLPRMPGRRSARRRSARLKRWIEQGAPYADHWSFEPPRRSALPSVQHPEWAHNAIDYFILERLEREGLEPSPEAARHLLLRRLSFDLRGLPPTLGRSRRVRQGPAPERLRAAGRPVAERSGLRRTLGRPLAGSGSLRRFQRLGQRSAATQYVALSGLGHRRLQLQPAV